MKYLQLYIIVLIASCKAGKPNLAGSYAIKQMPTISLKLEADSTFRYIYIYIYKNPYLHPFEHPERYFTTQGRWSLNAKSQMVLNSDSTVKNFEDLKIDSVVQNQKNNTRFEFLDIYNNTIPILFVEHKDSTLTSVLHASMQSYEHVPNKPDNLKFAFYGYDSFSFNLTDTSKKVNYMITMRPKVISTFFNQKKLEIRGNNIIDKGNKFTYKLSK